jgi:O-antigen ligase
MVALFFDELLMSMSRFLSRFGIDSRSIALLLQPGLDLSGRDLLYSRVIAEIMDNPITGIGIGGDRRVLNGVYAHNLLIELVADYGIPLGSLFVLVLLGLMIRFSHSRDKCQRNVFAMWLNISVIPLLVSGSYLESTGFWICLGMLVQDVTVTCKH